MPTDGSPSEGEGARGTYAKGVARRQEILDRAIEVFAERGAAGTSLRAIAQAIGVSHAALTHYFTSREALLVEVYREAERRKNPAEPPVDRPSPVEGMARSAERNRSVPGLVQLYSTLVATALEDGHPEATAFATERFARVRSNIAREIRALQASGEMRADLDPEAAAALVIAASDGLQIQWLLDPSVKQDAALALLSHLFTDPQH
ncbi:TetR/AcrR family transcriptional regulator [Naasia lichenicola]|uniref:TetR/AcrR family transcriptional regulator n=1 Tax=Naasia lichenicola TaxID=2565933 RepID=A0A4S4FEV2_9MICO|nr:TetR/AcrR family transcriptional regulator [Naasia lichenicola]THG28700.1 TetR/AcrR family transcriptional regulator [Naasia lichenicola]